MNNKVSIVKCEEYSEVQAAVEKAVELIGGIDKFIKKGDKVVIKPNLVSRKKPEEAVTTNPAFLHAVILMAERAGGIVTIAESPGGPYNAAALKAVYQTCGIDKAIEGTNAKLNFDTSFSEVHFEDGRTVKNIPIINPILEADVIISLPKLKTHAMTSYTGAVKNLFGVVPGTYKAELHFRLDERKAFCSMLVDLHECVKPTLSIMDAIWGMEGNGPTAGQNRHIGLVIASENAHALDMAACHIIDYTPNEVDTVREAVERGLVAENADGLEIAGENIEPLVIKDFVKPESHFNLLKLISLPTSLNAFLTNALASRPKMDYGMCVSCGECARCCPPKAIDMSGGKPVIDEKKCIKCFCCQELCPKKAVMIKRPLLNRFMIKFLR
ncbi:MAG: DUF362 domain-containing protein [Oscillospiraceae bacterium]|nr:DUF362 domain-containing protein [Oscillospiraceae bacterium]